MAAVDRLFLNTVLDLEFTGEREKNERVRTEGMDRQMMDGWTREFHSLMKATTRYAGRFCYNNK